MPIFEYKGLNRQGRNVKGVLDAENLRAARAKLKKDGIYVINLKDKQKAASKNKRNKGPSRKKVDVGDLSMMTRQLATLIKANIPLVDALTAVSEQVDNPVLKEATADIKNQVNEGGTFYKGLSKYPRIFDNIYVSLCEAGEASGTLDVILIRLAEFTEAQNDLKIKVKSAMTYPVIMLFITFVLMIGMFIFVIPNMVAVFDSAPQLTLPWYTQLIIDISDFMINSWMILLIIGAAIYFMFNNWKKTESGSRRWDQFTLEAPVFGPVSRMVAVSRFTRTLSTLLTGGVPMLQALDIVRNVVNNQVLAEAVDDARNNISEGESIAGPLKKSGQFPPIVIHMVNIGEKTGELETMLTQVADAYDFQVKAKIDSMTSLMGPVVIVIMGVVVAIIVFSIMIPMFEMTNLAG